MDIVPDLLFTTLKMVRVTWKTLGGPVWDGVFSGTRATDSRIAGEVSGLTWAPLGCWIQG